MRLEEIPALLDGKDWPFVQWLTIGPLKVYIRLSKRHIGEVNKTIEIANVAVAPKQRGDGHFTKFIDLIENWAKSNGRIVFIENILEPRFAEFFKRRGYKEYFLPDCLYKD